MCTVYKVLLFQKAIQYFIDMSSKKWFKNNFQKVQIEQNCGLVLKAKLR